MRVSVRNPQIGFQIQDAYAVAKRKNVKVDIEMFSDIFIVKVTTDTRLVGKFVFTKYEIPYKEDEECTLTSFHIIDKAYMPVQVALVELTKYLKRRKIKYINIKDDIINL